MINLNQKHESYTSVLPQKNWVDWINTRLEKMPKPRKYTISKKDPKLKCIAFLY